MIGINWKEQFKEEFGIHFSKSELQFVLEFIEELLSKQVAGLERDITNAITLRKFSDDLNEYWRKRCKEEKIATAVAGEQMCEMRLKKQKEEIENKETFSPEFEAGERSTAKAVLERIEKGLGLEHIKLLCLAISVSQR